MIRGPAVSYTHCALQLAARRARTRVRRRKVEIQGWGSRGECVEADAEKVEHPARAGCSAQVRAGARKSVCAWLRGGRTQRTAAACRAPTARAPAGGGGGGGGRNGGGGGAQLRRPGGATCRFVPD